SARPRGNWRPASTRRGAGAPRRKGLGEVRRSSCAPPVLVRPDEARVYRDCPGRPPWPPDARRSTLAGVAVTPDEGRLPAPFGPTAALPRDLRLGAARQRLVEPAAALPGAGYAALGVLDERGAGLERFLTTGIDEDVRAAIGDPPRGRGILGVMIREAAPLRL